MGEFIGFVEILDTRLAKPVYDYFNDAVDPPDTQGVLQTIEQIPGNYGDLDIAVDSLDGGMTPSGDVLQFDLKINATRRGEVCAENPAEDVLRISNKTECCSNRYPGIGLQLGVDLGNSDEPGSVPGVTEGKDDFDARTARIFHGLDPPPDAVLIPDALSQESTTSQENIREIVFIDSRVSDYDALIDSILSKNSPATKILIIDSTKDGIDQISEALSVYRNIDALHIISHGQSGAIRLGSSLVDSEALAAKSSALKSWGEALTADADILLYGCRVARRCFRH